jgi:hypothetical protein
MEQHKIELLPNTKSIKTKQGAWNSIYITMVKEELDKLLKARFIKLNLWKQLNGFLPWYWC